MVRLRIALPGCVLLLLLCVLLLPRSTRTHWDNPPDGPPAIHPQEYIRRVIITSLDGAHDGGDGNNEFLLTGTVTYETHSEKAGFAAGIDDFSFFGTRTWHIHEKVYEHMDCEDREIMAMELHLYELDATTLEQIIAGLAGLGFGVATVAVAFTNPVTAAFVITGMVVLTVVSLNGDDDLGSTGIFLVPRDQTFFVEVEGPDGSARIEVQDVTDELPGNFDDCLGPDPPPNPPTPTEHRNYYFPPINDAYAMIPSIDAEPGNPANLTPADIANLRATMGSLIVGLAQGIAGAQVEDAAQFVGVEEAIVDFQLAQHFLAIRDSASALAWFDSAFVSAAVAIDDSLVAPKEVRLPFQLALTPTVVSTKPNHEFQVAALVLGARDSAEVQITSIPLGLGAHVERTEPDLPVFRLQFGAGEMEPGNYPIVVSANDGVSADSDTFQLHIGEPPSTSHPIDVIFSIDMTAPMATFSDTVSINSDVFPFAADTFPVPILLDLGTEPDGISGDGIFTGAVRLPAGTKNAVEFWYEWNGSRECVVQGSRKFFLDDAEADTIGGLLGPQILPLDYWNRCDLTGRDIEVVLQANMTSYYAIQPLESSDTVAVNGTPNNQVPPVIDWSIPSLNPMVDDGSGWDQTAGDGIYTTSIVFPDSSGTFLEYRYLFNNQYECSTQNNRVLILDDAFDALGNPQILGPVFFEVCNSVTPAEDVPVAEYVLDQNSPNPFNPATRIRFSVPEAGPVSIAIYDVLGRIVAIPYAEHTPPGIHETLWDGRNRGGRAVASGVYFYRLLAEDGGVIRQKKMVLLR